MYNKITLIVYLIFAIFVCAYTFLSFITFIISKVPYVPSPKKSLKKLLSKIDIKKHSKVYDLGCGDGRFLFLAKEKEPTIIAKGYDMFIFPVWKARIYKFFKKLKNIYFYKKNFFKLEFKDADIIYMYLFPGITRDVYDKLKKYNKKILLISYRFEVGGIKADEKFLCPKSRYFYIYKLK